MYELCDTIEDLWEREEGARISAACLGIYFIFKLANFFYICFENCNIFSQLKESVDYSIVPLLVEWNATSMP